MTAPMLWGSYADIWQLYHKVTFDGITKQIIINPDVLSLDVEVDIYSSWKEWASTYDNLKFLPAFRTTGGDPLPGGRRVGQYFFLINGWKLIPPVDYLISDIELIGNLFSDDGGDIFDLSGFDNFRLIRQVVSQFTEIAQPTIDVSDLQIVVSGSGLTTEESDKLDSLVTLNTQQTMSLNTLLSSSVTQQEYLDIIIELQNSTTASLNTIEQTVIPISSSVLELLVSQSLTYTEILQQSSSLADQNALLLQQSSSLQTQLVLLNQQSSSLDQQTILLTNIENNTDQILATGGNLTAEQSTMLLEMYRLLGLDPTRPLIVSPTTRDAGGEISQTINKVGDVVTVTRE